MPINRLFSERQHFKQTWLWVLLIGVNVLFVYGIIRQVFFGVTFGDKPISNGQLIVVASAVLLLTFLFVLLRLDTVIQHDGICYRFFPLQWKYKKITWDSISKAYLRQYNPITEYGGWGLRTGLFGNGQAFTISGNKGLQLVYNNKKKFLLGTQRPEEMEQVLKQLGRLTTGN
ncbi:hypothetical protein FC093_08110 [Ilyomonas limi]|uniref:Uncharacterized protein n=1 Tax=Ilyomonas limi TaxID=2575867 RepID=A0A4V5UUJ1_9BACT|nr:hypothetical protein [Ilyomonas limi]TKK69273.1 hypothetical protein FC093_08110 [Ilyomonas limi]